MKILLTRTVNDRKRYYAIELIANLFGEFLLVRTYGGCARAKPTGVIHEIYQDQVKAQHALEVLLEHKYARGYELRSK
jgi:predicted DNA-binding WGR domain protein